ncbi:transglycosylase SLT domain-containing protein, partial [bacterium]|nr:transglycosylase SLT domain-containing protein [bacterium]
YNTNLIGKNGEIGLMQIKLSTAQMFNPKLAKEDLLDWRKNIYYGCLYLKAHKEYNKNNNNIRRYYEFK